MTTEIKFLSRMEATPKARTSIFALAPVKADAKALQALAKQFGLSGAAEKGKVTQDAAKLTYAEGPLQVSLYKASGGVRFQDTQRWQVDDGKSNIEYKDADAVAAAKRFVAKLELAPADELQVLKVTRLRVGHATEKGEQFEERVVDVGVVFQRLIGGVPVDGPGGKLVVYLDKDKQPTGVDRIWRTLRKASAPVKLRPPQFAEKDLIKRWVTPDTDKNTVNVIEVREVRFGYFELGWESEQTAMQPAYIMPLSLITPMSPEQRTVMNSVHVCPAAEKPSGPLMPPAKKPRKLKPRKK